MRDVQLQLLLDLGIIDLRTDEGEAFFLWGALVNDPILRARRFQNATGVFAQSVPEGVATFTPAEKIALRDRVRAAAFLKSA